MSHLPTGEPGEEYTNPFIVEAAKSARAACTACKEVIGKGSVRVGQVVTTVDKPQFGRSYWRHLGCVTNATIRSVVERLEAIENAQGWTELSAANRTLVHAVFEGDAAALAQAREANRAAVAADAAEAAAAAAKKAAAAQRKADKQADAGAALEDKPAKKGKHTK